MTSRRSIGSVLVLLACCMATMASTASATIPAPPGGPILVVTPATSDEFRNYVPEIMRGEGLNDFATASVSSLSPALLSSYDVVVLSRTALSDAQAAMLSDWVNAGGNLIAMRPDTRLAGLLGISPLGNTADDANLSVDTSRAPGAGITTALLQYHGPADRYGLAGATSVATLELRHAGGDPAHGRRRSRRRLHLRPLALGRRDPAGQPRVGRAGARPRRGRTRPRRRHVLRQRRQRPAVARPLPGGGPLSRRAAAPAGQPHHRDVEDADPALLVPPRRLQGRRRAHRRRPRPVHDGRHGPALPGEHRCQRPRLLADRLAVRALDLVRVSRRGPEPGDRPALHGPGLRDRPAPQGQRASGLQPVHVARQPGRRLHEPARRSQGGPAEPARRRPRAPIASPGATSTASRAPSSPTTSASTRTTTTGPVPGSARTRAS